MQTNNTPQRTRIAVAMSGGVDSSVAAYLLKKEGHEVLGFSMQLWPRNTGGGCCGINALNDAARVAAELGIPHYVLDVRQEFRDKVIDPFYKSYEMGETPNPCVRCNEFIKFDYLLKKAEELDAKLATGHYAQILFDPAREEFQLRKGVDPDKDQSYALYRLSQYQLSRSLFPVGRYTKPEIRAIAKEAALYVAEKAESQDICFQDKTNFRDLMAQFAPAGTRPGEIVNRQGQTLGQHQGIAFYTIGQRKRLGIAAPRPLYVLAIEPRENKVVVGYEEELERTTVHLKNVHMISSRPAPTFDATSKIRYATPAVSARVELKDNQEALVTFDSSLRAVAPGQSTVFYQEDHVLGGGIIA